jgi:hypothetical protein
MVWRHLAANQKGRKYSIPENPGAMALSLTIGVADTLAGMPLFGSRIATAAEHPSISGCRDADSIMSQEIKPPDQMINSIHDKELLGATASET